MNAFIIKLHKATLKKNKKKNDKIKPNNVYVYIYKHTYNTVSKITR